MVMNQFWHLMVLLVLIGINCFMQVLSINLSIYVSLNCSLKRNWRSAIERPYLIIPLLYFCSSEIGGFTQSLPHILHPIWPFHYHFFILLKQRLHIVAHSMSTTIVGYIIALFSYWLVQYDIWCCFLRLMVMLFCQFCRLRLLWWALYIIYMIYFKPLFLCVCSFI